MNFIERQTAWYNEMSDKLNSVSLEMMMLKPNLATKRVRFFLSVDDFINATHRLSQAFKRLENVIRNN